MIPEPLDAGIPLGAPAAPEVRPPSPPAWDWHDLVLLVGLGAGAAGLAYAATMLGYVALSARWGWHVPPQSGEARSFLSLALQMVFYVLLFAAVYALVALRRRRPFWKALSWQRPSLRSTARFFAAGIVLSAAVEFAPTLFPDRSNFPLREFFTSPAVAYAVGVFAVLIAPLMEELIFRGVLFAIFESRVGMTFAIVSTAVLFTAMHIPEYEGAWNHLFLLLLVGLVFSAARGWTRSLAPSVILHAAYNLTQVFLLYMGTQQFRTLQGFLLKS
jgi:membrane protease YdiL (CAAX protease family)